MSKKFLKVKEVAAILGVSASLIYAQVAAKLIPHKRLGKRILIPAAYVESIAA